MVIDAMMMFVRLCRLREHSDSGERNSKCRQLH
jgi:hypothetical protein